MESSSTQLHRAQPLFLPSDHANKALSAESSIIHPAPSAGCPMLEMPVCLIGNWQAAPLPLADEGAWRILEQFLTTDVTYPQMEEAFSVYLGGRYIADDWKDARDALFSGDGDDSIALANLYTLKARHMPLPSHLSRVDGRLSSTPIQHLCKCPKLRTDSSTRVQQMCKHLRPNPYIITEADESEGEEVEVEDAPSVRLPKVAHFSGPSAKDRLAAAFDNIFDRIGKNPPFSPERRQTHPCKAASSSHAMEGRMYLLHVQRNGTDYIAEHLWSQGFPVTVSAWAADQLTGLFIPTISSNWTEPDKDRYIRSFTVLQLVSDRLQP
ncbi:hypothetical protein DFH29DRAFT_1002583 [Suillus ampliporus]|nr:hypothetical protein DFH29DRAFT_1002583 [Suillus ampliporus]